MCRNNYLGMDQAIQRDLSPSVGARFTVRPLGIAPALLLKFLHPADDSTPIWLKEGRHEMSSSIGIYRCESGVAESLSSERHAKKESRPMPFVHY